MRLALDHHYSTLIASGLRQRGHDVAAAVERAWHILDDDELLEVCDADQRVLLTNDVAAFAVLARQWMAQGRAHHGLVFTSDASFPRTRHTVGQYVETLDRFMREHPGDRALIDRIHWLGRR